jgi:hypothetical protein
LRRFVTVVVLGCLATACSSSSKDASSSPTTSTLAGDPNSSFCTYSRDASNALTNKPPPSATDVASTKKYYDDLQRDLEHAASLAPAAIHDDYATFLAFYKQLVAAYAAADYDVSKLRVSDLHVLENPNAIAAASHISTYIEQVCQLATTPST